MDQATMSAHLTPHAYIRNLTPHAVTLIDSLGSYTFQSEGIARAVEQITDLSPLDWCVHGDCGYHITVPTVRKTFGVVEGLPAPTPNVMLIVSQIVLDASPGRTDLLVPHDTVRDEQGRIVGCRGFSRRA